MKMYGEQPNFSSANGGQLVPDSMGGAGSIETGDVWHRRADLSLLSDTVSMEVDDGEFHGLVADFYPGATVDEQGGVCKPPLSSIVAKKTII